ncbi:MAG: hypothetical protein NW224_25060 [Leptolyngbyaceae cyanobacterium bins.302]|nr:hypothetical protein [Leptolyngbyaceae cyanobacterium bins.302]
MSTRDRSADGLTAEIEAFSFIENDSGCERQLALQILMLKFICERQLALQILMLKFIR